MFRQILISKEHRRFQRILWRLSKLEPVQDFCLNTVTYGINSSPFLAIRTLLFLAESYTKQHPHASQIIQNDSYVDDIVSGENSVEDALKYQNDLIQLLSKGGFELHKWASNSPELLSHLPSSRLKLTPLSLDDTVSLKILGLQWNPHTDTFSYKISTQVLHKTNTTL